MRKMNYLMIVCAVAVCSVFCNKANAEEHKHDGFFLRLAPGLGGFSASETLGTNELEVSGRNGLFNFSIGGALTENLILHLDTSGMSSSDPTIKMNGQSGTTNGKLSTSVIGVGLTSYFSSNVYLTGAIGIARTTYKSNGSTFETDSGWGINLMLGKEWWVSENWGLGVAGQFLYTTCPDPVGNGTTVDLITTSLGVLFSTTYK
jgi:hypothetical protein